MNLVLDYTVNRKTGCMLSES